MMTLITKLIDIGANLTDDVFQGIYYGKKIHVEDLTDVLDRALAASVKKVIITSGDLSSCHKAIRMIQSYEKIEKYSGMLSTTCGVHPTMCQEFETYQHSPDDYLHSLLDFVNRNEKHVMAIGELGLDYDRLHFCNKEIQLRYFEKQFFLAEKTKLPLFLHSRAAETDFLNIIKKHRNYFSTGVVHSFTGSLEHMNDCVGLGLFIGVNGCSLKTEQNLQVVRAIPLDRLLLETDAPWCSIRPTHVGFSRTKITSWPTKRKERWTVGHCIQGRSEPCHLVPVLEIVAAIHGISTQQLAEQVYKNTMAIFPNL